MLGVTNTIALEKTLRDGRRATVTVTPGGRTQSWIEGELLGSHYGPHHWFARDPGIPEEYVAAVGPLLLTAEEAAQVQAAYDRVRVIKRDLDTERDLLVRSLAGAEDDWAHARADRLDSGDWADPLAIDPVHEARVEEAAAALVAFDTAHPGIVARRRARDHDAMLRHGDL